MSLAFVTHLLLSIVAAHVIAEPIHPVCPPHSELRQCGRLCESTCARPSTVFCNPQNPDACREECRCLDGWVRNEVTNECVELSACPLSPLQSQPPETDCPNNENLHKCGRLCEPTCANKTPNRKFCPGIQCTQYTQRCRCNAGYYRDTASKACVLSEDCPPGDSTVTS